MSSKMLTKWGTNVSDPLVDVVLWLPASTGYFAAFAVFYGAAALRDSVGPAHRVTEAIIMAVAFLAIVSFVTVGTMRLVVDSPRWKFLGVQRHMGDVIGLSGLYFEGLIAELFESRGYQVRRRGGDRADGGIDLLIKQTGGQWAVVQCKQRRWGHVTVAEVREFSAVVARNKAPMGIIVTSGLFGSDAREWAAGEPLQLIDGPALWKMIEAKRSADGGLAGPRG